MAILKTYDLKGNKLSFANWISNLSPTETPFASMIGKEAVDQVMYSWQTDRLSAPSNAGTKEGDAFAGTLLSPTQVHTNFTQILRKVVRVSDTANKIGLYGRASEKAYQMEKAGKELKRDLELALLTQKVASIGKKGTAARTFSGFPGLVAPEGLKCPDTGAIVHKLYERDTAGADAFTEVQIFDITYNLYLAGSKANKIMVHPVHMSLFSNLINKSGGDSTRMFDGLDTKYNAYVKSIRDPLGQVFEIIPNRHMPQDAVYFFNESDWTQMVLRSPETSELAKTGSSEKHMIEMEVGLRHRNPFASGILALKAKGTDKWALTASLTHENIIQGGTPAATKLSATLFKNGVPDSSQAGASNMTVTATPAGIVSTPAAAAAGSWANGVWTFTNDIRPTSPGSCVLKVDHTTSGTSAAVSLVVHSKDLRGMPGEEFEVEVVSVEGFGEQVALTSDAKPKAKRKAKAE